MEKGHERVTRERLQHFTKHNIQVEDDLELNTGFQLAEAAQRLSVYKISYQEQFYPPFGWDPDWWEKMCNKPYEERLEISGALICAELDRVAKLRTMGVTNLNPKPPKDEPKDSQ